MKNYWAMIKLAVAVSSSHVADLIYDEADQVLTITWQNGRRYEYYDVPKHVYEEFMAAGSKGEYLNKVFKPMEFKYKEVA